MSSERRNGDAAGARQRHDEIAAGHGERAMREIDEAHQPHGDRQADRDDEQEHGIGQAVEQDADGDVGNVRHEPHPGVDENAGRGVVIARRLPVQS